MKKRKLLLSVVAAAVFATAAGALAACSDVELPKGSDKNPPSSTVDKTYTVTFVAGQGATVKGIASGGTTLTTDKNGKLTAITMPTAEKNENKDDYTFLGWGLTAGATSPTLTATNFNAHEFSGNTPVYAVFKPKDTPTPPGPILGDEYKITFYAGLHGTISGQNEIQTSSKKISKFPTVKEDNGWKLDYWALTDDETTHVDENYTFTQITSVTAHYKEDENYNPNIDADTYYLIGSITEWGVDTDAKYVFTKTEDSYGKDQYLLTAELKANDTIKIVKGNKTQYISSWEENWDFADIDTSETANKGNLTITQDGTYEIYLKVNKEDPNDTSVYVAKKGGGGGGEEVTGAYVLGIGGEGHWDPADGEHPLVINPDNDYCTEYAAENVTVSAGEQIKFWLNGTYYAHLQEEPAVPEDVATGGGYTNDAGNITIVEEGTYNFYLKIYGEGNGAGSHDIWISKVGGGGNNDDEGSNFYLFGKIGGVNKWSISAGGIKFVETELNPYEDGQVEVKYKAEATLSVNDEVKIFKSNDGNAWNYSNFEEGSVGVNCEKTPDGNIKIKRAGNYTVYLRMHKDGSNSVRVFYVAPQPAATATARMNNTAMPNDQTKIDNDKDKDKLVKWYVAQNVQLADNSKIKFYVNDQEVSCLFRVSSQLINGGVSGDNTMGIEFTMPKAGTFEFHLKYYIGEGWKVWINGTLDNPTPPPTPDTVNDGFTYGSIYENGTSGTERGIAILTGKFTGRQMASFDWQNGYYMTLNDGQYELNYIYLKAGDTVKVRYGGSDDKGDFNAIPNGGYNGVAPAIEGGHISAKTGADEGSILINTNGYYRFHFKPDWGSDWLWVDYSATKPNGENQGGGGGEQQSSQITFTFSLGDNYESNIKDVRIHLFVDDNTSYTTWNTDRDNGVNGGELMTGDGRTFTYTLTLDSRGPVKGIVITFRQDGWKQEQVAKCNDITGNFTGGNNYTFTFDTWTKEIVNGEEKDINWNGDENGEGYSWDLPFIAKQA
ncbi:MAG: hypothetical protein K2J01_03550 [Clostridiales bacterium]|nr:hypothetical protein [Clostridiales bacterium]